VKDIPENLSIVLINRNKEKERFRVKRFPLRNKSTIWSYFFYRINGLLGLDDFDAREFV
jgi:hypothetical protein